MAGGTGAAAVTAHVSDEDRTQAVDAAVGSGLPREFVCVLRPRGRPARRLDSSRASDTVKACALSSFASSQRRPCSSRSAAVCPFPPTAPRTTPAPRRADARSPRPGPRRWCCPVRGRRGSGWWMWRPHGGRRSGPRRHGRGTPPRGTPRRGAGRNGGPWDGRCRAPLIRWRRGRVRCRRARCRGSGIMWRRRGRTGPARPSIPVWCAGWRPAGSGGICCGCVIGRTDAEAAGT